MAPSPGIASSSATWTNASVVIFPFLTSGIDPLPERFDTKPLHGVNEKLVGTRAQCEVGLDNILDHVGDFAVRNSRPDQGADRGFFVGTAADRDLIEFLAVLLDAENADMADVMMATGIDATGYIDVQPPDQIGGVMIGKAPRQFLRDRDRARVGERAVIQSRAGDDVGDQVDVRRREAGLVERFP